MTEENLFLEIQRHLMDDEKPSDYLESIATTDLFFQYPFSMLFQERKTEQNPKFHPEGNVWNHTKLVVDEAAKLRRKSKNPQAFMWGALLHDVGKITTTKVRRGKITAYDHDKEGARLAQEFLENFYLEPTLIKEIVQLVRWHMQILFVSKDLPFGEIEEMVSQADIHEIALLGVCDRLGRTNVKRDEVMKDMEVFLNRCREVMALAR